MKLSTELDREKEVFIVHVTGKYRRPDDGFEAQHFVIKSFAIVAVDLVPGLQGRAVSDGMAILIGSQFSEAQLHLLLACWSDLLMGFRRQLAALFLCFRC